jgi:hypothetical protein
MWPPKHIDRVGLELEGGWISEPSSGAYHHDGSVVLRAPIIGEYVSQPLDPVDAVAWVQDPKVYPPFINKTCGMHVHISVKANRDYERMMVAEFGYDFEKAMTALGKKLELPSTHEFWKRLAGQNRYCLPGFIPDGQWTLTTKGTERYTKLNYCYELHGTLEVRVLPMFELRKTAGLAVKGLVRFVDGWISRARRRNEAEEPVLVASPVIEDLEEMVDISAGPVQAELPLNGLGLPPAGMHWEMCDGEWDLVVNAYTRSSAGF